MSILLLTRIITFLLFHQVSNNELWGISNYISHKAYCWAKYWCLLNLSRPETKLKQKKIQKLVNSSCFYVWSKNSLLALEITVRNRGLLTGLKHWQIISHFSYKVGQSVVYLHKPKDFRCKYDTNSGLNWRIFTYIYKNYLIFSALYFFRHQRLTLNQPI